MTTTKYSMSVASRLIGKSRNTLARDMREGKLSWEEGPDGSKQIDASELMRVYGDAFKLHRLGEGAKKPPVAKNSDSASTSSNHSELNALREQLQALSEERERERSQLRQQIDYLQDALKVSQETQTKTMLLLEHRTSGGGEWQAAIKQLEERIAKQEEGAKRQLAEITEKARKEAQENIKSKYWWQVVFGE